MGKAEIAYPKFKAFFGGKIHEQLLGRKANVGGPAVFLALGAVGGEIVEVGNVGMLAKLLDFVDFGIGALKAASLFYVGMDGYKGQKLGCGLLVGYAAYKHIAEAVVGESWGVVFYSAALTYIFVGLTVAFGLEKGRLVAEFAVDKLFAVAQGDFLTGLAVYFKTANAGIVYSEVI